MACPLKVEKRRQEGSEEEKELRVEGDKGSGIESSGRIIGLGFTAGGMCMGPWGLLVNPCCSTIFGLWIEAQQSQNCTQERSREARGEPMAQVGGLCLEHVAL